MARQNLQYMDLPVWARRTGEWGLHGVAVGTALARVEAGKHYLSDVLVGYALGNFVASFMQEAFFHGADSVGQVSFVPVERGGALTVTLPVR